MLTFSQFVKESWNVSTYHSVRYSSPKILANNRKTIDGHDVSLDINGHQNEKHFTANYTVDGSYFKERKIAPKTGKKIVQHVGRSINSFVRHMKPKKITFSSKEDRKIDLHNKLANRLARRHGGRVEVSQGAELTHHTVHFDDRLDEVVRDVPRAKKLINYIMQRNARKGASSSRENILTGADRDNSIIDRVKEAYPPHPKGYNTANSLLSHWEPKAKTKSFFVDDLTPAQKTVHGPSVIGKLEDTDPGDKGPIRVVTWNRTHYVVDGHHRYMAARARGDLEIDAIHHTVPSKGKKKL